MPTSQITTRLNAKEIKEVFHKNASVFEKQVDPYLLKFVHLQYDDPKTEGEKMLQHSLYFVYKDKATNLRTDLLPALLERKDVTSEFIWNLLEESYRREFPGLDKPFFDNVKDEVNRLK